MKPLFLQLELLPYTNAIRTAGERAGKALDRANRQVPWWMFWYDNTRDMNELRDSWEAYNAAFDRLYAFIDAKMSEAYEARTH